MVNENSKKNLKPFKKGKDPRRNTKGKKALPDLKDLIEELGDEGMKAVITALHAQAKKGNVKAIEALLDRYYGKTAQAIDLSSKDGTMKPIIGITFKEDE